MPDAHAIGFVHPEIGEWWRLIYGSLNASNDWWATHAYGWSYSD